MGVKLNNLLRLHHLCTIRNFKPYFKDTRFSGRFNESDMLDISDDE